MKSSYVLFITCCLLHAVCTRAQVADLILTNGKIFTSDSSALFVSAIAIRGQRVLAVGTDAAVTRLAGPKTRRVDLGRRTVVPGFNDAHDHPGFLAHIGKGYDYIGLNVRGLSKQAVLDSVRRLLPGSKPGEWIEGFIGTDILFD